MAPSIQAASEPVPAEPLSEVVAAPQPEQPAQQIQAPAAEPEPVAPEVSATKATPAAEPQAAEESEAIGVEVERGDTLAKIAAQVKPTNISLERMLVALYLANVEVFDGKNMNRIRAGKILALPDADAIDAVTQKAAVKQIRAQVTDWNIYRQQLAAAHPEAKDQAGRQEASGKVSTTVAESKPAAKEPAKEVLKLSKGEAPGDQTGAKASAQDRKHAQEEEAVAKNKALQEAQQRAALLEKNVKDLQRLAELKKTKPASAATPPAASAPAAASAAVAAPVAPRAKPKIVVPAKTGEQPSMLDDLLGNPVMLGAVAAALLGLGGLGFVMARRKKSGKQDNKIGQAVTAKEEIGEATGSRIAAPVAPSPETGDFTQATANAGEAPAPAGTDEVDPISEADLFLTFGRDVQAEEVLKEALKTNPGNIPVKLKLLSVYANRKDVEAFNDYAQEIKASGDETAWAQAAALGQGVDPSNALYGGSGSSAPVESPVTAEEPAVDFDLGFGAGQSSSLGNTVMLEKPSQEKTTILTPDELRAAQETPMDFDITGTHPGIPAQGEAAAAANPDEMLFDVTSTHPGLGGAAEAPAPGTGGTDDLIFDVTTSAPVSVAETVAPAADAGLAFTLDFPSEFKTAPATSAASAPADIGLGDISLNLDNLAAPVATASSAKDERWHEVATKLDLAKAYQEMGDAAGAKEILDEVLRDGDEQQRANAQAMLQQL